MRPISERHYPRQNTKPSQILPCCLVDDDWPRSVVNDIQPKTPFLRSGMWALHSPNLSAFCCEVVDVARPMMRQKAKPPHSMTTGHHRRAR